MCIVTVIKGNVVHVHVCYTLLYHTIFIYQYCCNIVDGLVVVSPIAVNLDWGGGGGGETNSMHFYLIYAGVLGFKFYCFQRV